MPTASLPNIKIVEVVTSAQLKKFLRFPWTIYADDPNWVPPLLMEQRRLLDRKKNPGLKHCVYKAWIIYKDDMIAGRIIAFVDHSYITIYNEQTGFLGFFESINDQTIANALFDVSTEWLKNGGINRVTGPMNFSIANECGVQLTGFDSPPTIQMSYTPVYYQSLFEKSGFAKVHDLFAYSFSADSELGNEHSRLHKICEKIIERSDVVLRTINMKDYKNELSHVNSLYNSFMADNWGFVPSSLEEMLFVGESMKWIVDPELIFFAEVKGKVVGCSLTIPDFNQVLIHLNGTFLPFGIFKMLYYKRKIKKLRLMLLGVDEAYRSKGLDILFYYHSIRKAREGGYTEGELSWISEDNKVLISIVEKIGAKLHKTYRMYEKTL